MSAPLVIVESYVFQGLLCTRYRKLDSRRPLLKAPKAA
ncbi:unnamed protein product [Prunus brigantina]